MSWSLFLSRLVEAIDTHLGRFSNARLIVRDAQAEAEAKRILARGDLDAENIRQGKMSLVAKAGGIGSLVVKDDELTYEQRVLARFEHQELKKDENAQRMVAYAVLEGHKERIDPDAEQDDDLLSRIFNEAQYVSKDDLQVIWGRLLAGAISRPNAYTVDVVDFLRRLNSARAAEVARMGPYVIGGDAIVPVRRLDQVFPEGFSYWIRMEHYGLIDGVASKGFGKQFRSYRADGMHLILYGDKVLIWSHSERAGAEFTLDAYMVTDLGKQVLCLGSFLQKDVVYFEQVAHLIKNKYPNLKAVLADVERVENDEVYYRAPVEVTNAPASSQS